MVMPTSQMPQQRLTGMKNTFLKCQITKIRKDTQDSENNGMVHKAILQLQDICINKKLSFRFMSALPLYNHT